MNSTVLVIPAEIELRADHFLRQSNFFFMNRLDAEVNREVRQVIPYIVIVIAGRALAYRRSQTAVEQRLAGSLSLGWGGHIEPVDGPHGSEPSSLKTYLRNCSLREIREELSLGEPDTTTELGLIDENSEVGSFHIGWLEVWTYRQGNPAIALDTASETLSLSIQDLSAVSHHFEPWSQIAINRILASKVDI